MSLTALEKNTQKWFDTIKDFLKSGLDKEAYCGKHDLDQQRLIYWLGRYYEVSRGLIPATVSNSATQSMVPPQSVCDFKLASGHEVTINKNDALTPELSRLIYRLSLSGATTNAATV